MTLRSYFMMPFYIIGAAILLPATLAAITWWFLLVMTFLMRSLGVAV